MRLDYDVQLLWQLDNLGAGNRARVRQREAETRLAQVELARIQTRVSAEGTGALAELIDTAARGPFRRAAFDVDGLPG